MENMSDMPDNFKSGFDQLKEIIELRNKLLQEEIDRRFSSFQLQIDQRFTASQQAVQDAMIAADKAVQAALKAAELAVNKAEVAAEKRFDSVNEFRQTLSDQTKSFVTQDRFDGLVLQVQQLTDRLNSMQGITTGERIQVSGQQASAGYRIVMIGVAVSALAVIINLIITFVVK